MLKLKKEEYAAFYKPYIQALLDNDKTIIENLKDSLQQFEQVLGNIDAEKELFRYAEGKWTIKELVQHIIDTERVFNYRALRFARKDKTTLHGFDENDYVENSNANPRNFDDLLEEFIILRKSTLFLYQSFTEDMLKHIGVASDNYVSVRALGFITSGHLIHHLEVIKNRYL